MRNPWPGKTKFLKCATSQSLNIFHRDLGIVNTSRTFPSDAKTLRFLPACHTIQQPAKTSRANLHEISMPCARATLARALPDSVSRAIQFRCHEKTTGYGKYLRQIQSAASALGELENLMLNASPQASMSLYIPSSMHNSLELSFPHAPLQSMPQVVFGPNEPPPDGNPKSLLPFIFLVWDHDEEVDEAPAVQQVNVVEHGGTHQAIKQERVR